MKRLSFPRRPLALVQAVFLLCLPLLLPCTGCYSDPNISGHERVDLDKGFPPGDQPTQVASVGPATFPGQPTAIRPDASPEDGSAGKVAIGDSLTIAFSDVPLGALPANMNVKVGSDGSFTLPYNKVIVALGKSPADLEREIRNAYVPSLFVNCTAVVRTEERYFFVGGEVKVSSRQIFTSHSMTVLRAITTAGGFTDFAKKTKIEVRRANGGKTEYINYYKALKDPKLDLPVFPNDQVIVPRGI